MKDEFEKWLDDEIGNDVYPKQYRTHLMRVRAKYRTLASAVEVEPLAVIGQRHARYVQFVWNDVRWFCHITDGGGDIIKIINGPTYAECEAKARAYLNGPPPARGQGGSIGGMDGK